MAVLHRQNSRHSSPLLSLKTGNLSTTQSYTSSERSSSIPSARDQEAIDGRSLPTSGSRSAEPTEPSPYVNIDHMAKSAERVEPVAVGDGEEERTADGREEGKVAAGKTDPSVTGPLSPGGTAVYENWQFVQLNELQKPTHGPLSPPPASPKKKSAEVFKKPMPIQRKLSPTSAAARSLASPTRKPPPPPSKAASKPSVKPEPTERQQQSEDVLSPEDSSPPTVYSPVTVTLSTGKLRPLSDFPTAVSKLAKATSLDNFPRSKKRPGDDHDHEREDDSTSRRLPETKPRSYTTANVADKKLPMFPPSSKSNQGSNKLSPLQSSKPPDQQTIPEVSEETASTTTEPAVQLRLNSKPSVSKLESVDPPKFAKSTATTAGTKSTAAQATVANKSSKDSRFPSESSKPPKTQSRSISVKHSGSSGASGGINESELMRKLSLRRQKIDQQIAQNKPDSTSTIVGTPLCVVAESPSERTSTASSQSELVVSYSPKDSPSDGTDSSAAVLRKPEEGNLAKFGIIEDTEGGSYVI